MAVKVRPGIVISKIGKLTKSMVHHLAQNPTP